MTAGLPAAAEAAPRPGRTFDLQAHRGGLGQGTVAAADCYLRQNPAYFHGPDVPTLQRRYGLTVVPYTVNDAAVMQRVIDLGVDGLITDDPDLLVTVAVRNGLR
ncbi:glycerophosphodiester phosphodiesterase family protein [Micromonospora sp. NPDC007230]|uniref:glycerophosphodiester phosphodiesterase n=1 Tax=Micromonospora sp. NPDC007230 TaxID=3364237 RepID=UPI0036840B74